MLSDSGSSRNIQKASDMVACGWCLPDAATWSGHTVCVASENAVKERDGTTPCVYSIRFDLSHFWVLLMPGMVECACAMYMLVLKYHDGLCDE